MAETTQKASSPDLKDLQPKPKSETPDGPRTGDIVLVRQDIQNLIPAIVTNDYAGQNTAGVVAVVTFSAAPYGGSPVGVVANCQPETKDTAAKDITTNFYGYWMPLDSPLKLRNLQKELDGATPKATSEAGAP